MPIGMSTAEPVRIRWRLYSFYCFKFSRTLLVSTKGLHHCYYRYGDVRVTYSFQHEIHSCFNCHAFWICCILPLIVQNFWYSDVLQGPLWCTSLVPSHNFHFFFLDFVSSAFARLRLNKAFFESIILMAFDLLDSNRSLCVASTSS